jgi:glutamate formiminotransferase/formiminotetrahydrofolate cyclodeaminase
MRLVECVPNFSEGRDQHIIGTITASIEEVDGAHLLDVDPGKDTNRTVVTFVADPDAAVEAAFQAIATAARVIDMSRHKGAHARMGATDVCPFVPVGGVSMDDCAELARRLGERVGKELGITVYLYEHAATSEERRNLATVRSGEYEGLAEKLKDPHWKPDFGPAELNARSGATAIGAREFLIAYNVNLNTKDRKQANDVALTVREGGRNKRDSKGKFVRDADGNPVKEPGTLTHCKAVGWYIEEYRQAQVSINLTNMNVTPPHVAFDEVKKQAELRGMRVTGSEIVGLVPLGAMREAGVHYLELQGRSTGVPEKELIETAMQSLGLSDITPFDPKQKIIEYRVAEPRPLIEDTVAGFVDLTSTDSPVPGGGSVAALMGALASALASMVANLTVGKKGYKQYDEEMKRVAVTAQTTKDFMVRAVDDDSRSFDAVIAAMRLPKNTDAEKAARDRAIEDTTKHAIAVPFGVLDKCQDAIDPIATTAEHGNVNSLSDAGVAAGALKAAAYGAMLNVFINLEGVADADYVSDTRKRAGDIYAGVAARCDEIAGSVRDRLENPAS